MTDLAKQIKKADLRYVTDESPGISRKKKGDKWLYFLDEKIVKDPKIIKRVDELVIPPAWDKVWICARDDGYLQATGFDDKGRKQYLYHEDWSKQSQENKFSKMTFFGEVLPEIRRKISRDMLIKELNKEKILATVVWLLQHTFIRIGNEEYVKENNSYGLTTLRNKHVKVRGENVSFEFRGKSGIDHSITFSHPKVSKIIKECFELPGYEVFQYLDERGDKHGIDSGDVNEYLKSITGEDVTAKDFRTWGGTTLSAESLYKMGFFETEEAAKKNINGVVKIVAAHLGNTPKVCRCYYIHPTVLDSYQERILVPHYDKILSHSGDKPDELTKKEYAVLTLLQEYS
jgi:DNA topoisomerase I